MNHVHDFAAPTAVSAAYDDEMRALLRRTLQDESADGPFSDVVARLVSLAS